MSRARLPDHAAEPDARGIPIDRVGIRGLAYPIVVWDRANRTQATVATIDASVTLPADVKGTHMSRFVEVLNGVRGELSLKNLPDVLAAIQRRLEAEDAQLDVRFPYFVERRAPVSGVASLMSYQAGFHARRSGGCFQFTLSVRVPVTTLCPCSKAVSAYGAHNQRGLVDVEIRGPDFLWIEDVVDAVEACASAPLYALLKREDEKWVTERAYDNPRFVEDLVRDVTAALRPRATWLRVSVENLESIHNHSAWAELVVDGEAVDAPSVASADPPAAAPEFGAWLRAERAARGWSQAELGRRVGVSAALLSRVECGARALAPGAFEALAAALGQEADVVRLRAGILPDHVRARIAADPEATLRWCMSGA